MTDIRKTVCALSIVVLGLVAGGFLAGEEKKGTVVADKVYENIEYGYSLSYPEGYDLYEYPGDYPKSDARTADSIIIGKPGVGTALLIIKGTELLPGADSLSLSKFASLMKDMQIACDQKTGRVRANVSALGLETVGNQTSYVFSFVNGFEYEYDPPSAERCAGFATSQGVHEAYFFEASQGIKFLFVIKRGDLVGESVLGSVRFKQP